MQLREEEHYSLHITPNEKRLGSFSVSIRCAACGQSITLHQKNVSTYIVSNWYRHAKLCFTKAKSATRLTQRYLPKSFHSSAKITTHDTASKTDLNESEKNNTSVPSSPALDSSSISVENEISSDNLVFYMAPLSKWKEGLN